jgi:hypothetical protein
MDPLNGVSTDRGRNMRETCLRVLAAGLMTGAIAAVVGMSTLVGTSSDPGRPIATARPAEHHPIRIHVAPAPPRRNAVKRPRSPREVSTPIRQTVISRRVVIIHTKAPRRQLAASKLKPKATPAPAPAPASPIAESPPVHVEAATPSPSLPASDENDDGKHGHGFGHDKEHGRGHEKHED